MEGPRALVLTALTGAGVRYVVVGGVAVVLHGHLRTTIDLDLVVELSQENALLAMEVLEAAGFVPVVPVPARAFADPQQRERWRREKHMMVFSLWRPEDPTFKVGLFAEEPFDVEAVWERAAVVELAGAEVRVASIGDLIAKKKAAGRAQDLADVEALRGIER